MPALEIVSALNTFVNVVIGLWFLPAAILMDADGRFRGVVPVKFIAYTMLLLTLNTNAMLQAVVWSSEALIKIILMTCVPIVAAYLMKRFYFVRLPDHND